MNEFQGRIALVSGGGSGIGRACAVALAQAGAKVVVSDLPQAGGGDTVAAIEAVGGEGMFVAADVTREEQVADLVQQVMARYGRLDAAINSAGIFGRIAPLAQQSLEDFRKIVAINLTGVFLCMKHEVAAMLQGGSGAIVNIASVQGLVSGAGASLYSASKHGVLGLTKGAALDYARSGVRINAICPGTIETPLARKYYEERGVPLPNGDPRIPIGRVGRPEEVAQVAVFLCSDGSSYMTGVALPVDGAITAQ